VLFSHLRLVLPSDLFPSGFPTNKLYVYISFLPFVRHALPIPSSLSWRGVQIISSMLMWALKGSDGGVQNSEPLVPGLSSWETVCVFFLK
jgi:hypothetical protein